MDNLLEDFEPVSKDRWKNKLIDDLRGKSPELLSINDPVEEIHISSFHHKEERIDRALPGNPPYTRGANRPMNSWNNGVYIKVEDEESANTKALSALMSGADLLILETGKNNIDWKKVLKGVETEHIKTVVKTSQIKDFNAIRTLSGTGTVVFNFDLFKSPLNEADWSILIEDVKNEQKPMFLVDGTAIQGAGGTSWQEIAFCLNVGHEYLIKIIESGLSVDEAAAGISFSVGIGSNYFLESVKIRTLRFLWDKVVGAYNPEHECSRYCSVSAIIGHMNKSLKDPYTNLLRQTTEAMSAVNGDVEDLTILPYDLYSRSKSNDLSQRMALNISSILKEESYFDRVIDPLGGSYSVEQLMEKIKEKAWENFLQLENNGGLFNEQTWDTFKTEIHQKRSMRIDAIRNDKTILIGVNKYPNPEEVSAEWLPLENYRGLQPLILEVETEKKEA